MELEYERGLREKHFSEFTDAEWRAGFKVYEPTGLDTFKIDGRHVGKAEWEAAYAALKECIHQGAWGMV